MLAGNANRIADGEEPLTPSTPRGRDEFSQSMALARIHQYLSMATPLLWTRQPDTIGVLGLALNACYERNGYAEELDQIKELLLAAQELWRELPEIDDEGERVSTRRCDLRARPPRGHHRGHAGCLSFASTAGPTSSMRRSGRSLADWLREDLGLTGTKIACNEGHCGACTVQLDGVPVLSCITLVHRVDGEVTTIEGLRDHPLVDAFVRADALQCGFCTPGQIVSATALVAANPTPTPEEIRHAMAGNLCRCGTYPKIEEAIASWQG